MSQIRYHGVLLWNDVEVDWSSVCTWFGTRIGPGVRMWAYGLVYPLFVAQITWFGMPMEPMGHMKLLLSKGVSLIRGEVG